LLYLQGPYSLDAIACCLQLQEPTSLGILKLLETTWILTFGGNELLQRED